LRFLDLGAPDPANVFNLGFGPLAGRAFRLGRSFGQLDLLLRRSTNLVELTLRLFAGLLDLALSLFADLLDLALCVPAGGFGSLPDGRLALGAGLLRHFGGVSLEGGPQLSAEGRHDAFNCRFELRIYRHGASTDYTARLGKLLTLCALQQSADEPP